MFSCVCVAFPISLCRLESLPLLRLDATQLSYFSPLRPFREVLFSRYQFSSGLISTIMLHCSVTAMLLGCKQVKMVKKKYSDVILAVSK